MVYSRLRSSQSRDDIMRELQHASKFERTDNNHRYILRGSLLKIINHKRVRDHLGSLFDNDNESSQLIDDIAGYVSPMGNLAKDMNHCHCQDDICTGSRIIFASLLLIGKEDIIKAFYASQNPKVCDNNLPFQDGDPASTSTHIPNTFHALLPIDKELFHHYQWQMRSPYIKRLGRDEEYIVLDPHVSLPWVELDIPKPEYGQISNVGRIQIDNDHHDLGRHDNFALKVFEPRRSGELDDRYFRKEIEANQRTPIHDRIVPLLAAFKHRERFYLILPWADGGNLIEMWKEYSTFSNEGMNKPLATWYSINWLITECLGISDSLAATHGLYGDGILSNTDSLAPQLHADIKPENILCFKSESESHTSLTLKLADFGFAVQAVPNSSLKVDDVVHTKTYRPPEKDVRDHVTLNFDVWCLGCLYLEFITWALDGWQGVEFFREQRMGEKDDHKFYDTMGQLTEDTFFKKTAKYPPLYSRIKFKKIREVKEIDLHEHPKFNNTHGSMFSKQYLLGFERSGIQTECRVKDKVYTHIEELQKHPRFDPALREFLSFITDKMLVINPEKRTNSGKVRQFLQQLKDSIDIIQSNKEIPTNYYTSDMA